MTPTKHERGQALILIVFAIIGLVGITALAVDGGNAFLQKRRTQNAADSTAFASALARIKGSGWISETYAIAKQNGFDNNGKTNTVQIFSPPVNGPYVKNVEYIQVIITNHFPTLFGSVIGVNELTVQAEAISRTKTPEIKEILNGNAVISLAPTSDCNSTRAFWVHGESTLDISGGGIFVNSNNPQCALITNGNGSLRLEPSQEISVVGGASIQKPKLLTPFPPLTNGIPISFPPPFFLPKIGCGTKIAQISEDGISMSPGGYGDDIFPPPGVHYLDAGVYCIGGDFILEGGNWLQGGGVVISMDEGSLRWNGGAHVDLGAPTGGEHAGLLIFAPIENKNRMVINTDDTSVLRGTILMPGANIHLNGGDSQLGYHSQIIGYTIESDGQSNIVIKYQDDQNYDTFNMPEIQLTQ